jgi:hypothetical protein
MDDAKARVLEKMRKDAMEWHKKNVSEESGGMDAVEEDSTKQELALVRELKKEIVEMNLDRASVYLSALATPEHLLERGKTPPTLPSVVKSLLRKDELKDKVLELTKRYKVGGRSFYYLWGLDDERDSEIY